MGPVLSLRPPQGPARVLLSSCSQPRSKANVPSRLSCTGSCRSPGAQLPAGDQTQPGWSRGQLLSWACGHWASQPVGSWAAPAALCLGGQPHRTVGVQGAVALIFPAKATVLCIKTQGCPVTHWEQNGVSLSKEGRSRGGCQWLLGSNLEGPGHSCGQRVSLLPASRGGCITLHSHRQRLVRGRPSHLARCGLKPRFIRASVAVRATVHGKTTCPTRNLDVGSSPSGIS